MPHCNFAATDEDYADFIVRFNNIPSEVFAEGLATSCIDFVNREYAILHHPLSNILPLSVSRYSYTAIPKLYTLLDTTSMEAAGIYPTFQQPSLSTKGRGTLIGFIDTGIDYQNQLFRNPDGTTRILSIWDQTITPDLPPSPNYMMQTQLLYGTEYDEAQLNDALSSADPLSVVPTTDENGHGTFLAGIAAGGATPSQDFIGAAPECRIAMVKLKPAKQYLRNFYLIKEDATAYQENDIMMGIKYFRILAERYRIPLTICIGLGTNQGSHEGTAPLGLTIRGLSSYLGVVCVCAAGNEVGYHHHYFGQIAANSDYDEAEIRVASGERGFTLELWARAPELYTVGFVSPSGEVIQRIPVILGNETKITFLLERTVITVNYLVNEVGSGSQLIFMRFETPTSGIWKIRIYNSLFINGQYHMWLPVRNFVSDETIFLRSNPDTTITDPGNTPAPITVSTYNHINNSIYIHSSRGFTRLDRIKPDLAAPGVDVYGPGLPTANGTSTMTRKTGSSVAAAHVAGAVADLLSWGLVEGNDLSISDASIKSYLIRGANRNPGYTYPNREFGYGTLDLYQTFLSLRE